VNKFWILLAFLFLAHCSFDTKSGFWTQDKKVKEANKNIIKIFKEEIITKKEFNTNLNLRIDISNISKKGFDNLTNNSGLVSFDRNIQKSSRFKFSRIENFDYFEPDLVYDGENFVFFDDKSNLLKFDSSFKTIWKRNFYTKKEKKLKPIMTFALKKNNLIVIDNIGKIYNINFTTGNLNWSKTNKNPFNSEIKIYNDKIYAIDLNNILRCFSLKNGEELWKFKSENTLLKSNKRNSLVIKKDKIYFNNSLGDIIAIDALTGSLLWQVPTQSTNVYENAFSLKMSDLVISDDDLIFSNNRNEFYSINLLNGVLNWKQNINSSVRPIKVDKFIFTFSNEGYLFTIDHKSGNIIKITDVFKNFKKKKKNKTIPVGFVVGINEILLTTSTGHLLIIDLKTGKNISILKIDKEKISRPFIFNKKVLLVKNDSIIRLN